MTVAELIKNGTTTGFSFEILPPLKGSSIEKSFQSIDRLCEFNPRYINITTHRSELVYKDTPDGLFRRVSERARPGTVAVAAAIKNRYQIPTVPHLICSGFTATETEYALIDLNFLGICDLLVLRGDKAKHESRFTPLVGGHDHAMGLEEQINRFNEGYFVDGTRMDLVSERRFSYGVAGYPEKHEESPNPDEDMKWLKAKVDMGAEYIVTQMCFDNTKFFAFVDRCRAAGITVPIVPGLKPISKASQLTLLPRVFHVDIPDELVREVAKCKDDAQVKQVGIEWCTAQSLELKARGVPSIHYYSLMAVDSVYQIAKSVY